MSRKQHVEQKSPLKQRQNKKLNSDEKEAYIKQKESISKV